MNKNVQPHLRLAPGDVAEIVLLPGDPGRIEKIIAYWDRAKQVTSNREFVTYTGLFKGTPISVCSTGIGCPSAAIAVEELANVGAKCFIRVGTCGSLKRKIKCGDLIVPQAAIRADGTTAEYLPKEFPAVADFEVFSALLRASDSLGVKCHTGINRTHDAFYEPLRNLEKWGDTLRDERMNSWAYPLVSSEMECSAVFLISLMRGLKAGAILAVNTEEPLDSPAASSPYELRNGQCTEKGILNAILVALEASRLLYHSLPEVSTLKIS